LLTLCFLFRSCKPGNLPGTKEIASEAPSYPESEVFEKFYSELKIEAEKNGEEFDLSEAEGRELFDLMQEEFLQDVVGEIDNSNLQADNFDDFLAKLKAEAESNGEQLDLSEAEAQELFSLLQDDIKNTSDIESEIGEDDVEGTNLEIQQENSTAFEDQDHAAISDLVEAKDHVPTSKKVGYENEDPNRLMKIRELQEALLGMPLKRVKKVLRAFESTLGYPSMLTLVPLLRETMPDRVSHGWLKRMNNKNAEFALSKAAEDGIVDAALLNSMLEVKANSGSINGTLELHSEQFAKHNLTPRAYSDRLVLQMLVANNRLPRALKFKQSVEEQGRNIDIASYGSLIQYYSRHNQLGSAVLLLKECIQTHGAPPSEAFLSQLRTLCKQNNVDNVIGLQGMIGKDPVDWLKHGERYLKRESSKKGRRHVQFAQNRILA